MSPRKSKNSGDSLLLNLMTSATLGVVILAVVFLAKGSVSNLSASAAGTSCDANLQSCVTTENSKTYCKICTKGGGGDITAAACKQCTTAKKNCQTSYDTCAAKTGR